MWIPANQLTVCMESKLEAGNLIFRGGLLGLLASFRSDESAVPDLFFLPLEGKDPLFTERPIDRSFDRNNFLVVSKRPWFTFILASQETIAPNAERVGTLFVADSGAAVVVRIGDQLTHLLLSDCRMGHEGRVFEYPVITEARLEMHVGEELSLLHYIDLDTLTSGPKGD